VSAPDPLPVPDPVPVCDCPCAGGTTSVPACCPPLPPAPELPEDELSPAPEPPDDDELDDELPEDELPDDEDRSADEPPDDEDRSDDELPDDDPPEVEDCFVEGSDVVPVVRPSLRVPSSLVLAFAGSSTGNVSAAAASAGGAGLSWSPALPRGRSTTTVVFCCTTTTTNCWMMTGACRMTVTGRRCSSGHVCPV
jgi:hypothetical protein